MRWITGLVAFTVLAGPVVKPLGAAPSEAERQSRRAFQEAEANFRAGRFAAALERYQAGYDQMPLPGFLINIAQCQRRLGDLRKARATYQKFLMVAPDSPHVTEVQGLVAELDRIVADLDAERSTPGQTPTAPTSPQSVTATAVPRSSTPSSAAPSAPSVSPSLLSAPVSPPAREPAPRRRWWLWTLAGAALIGAGATALALSISPGPTTIHEGTLATLRR